MKERTLLPAYRDKMFLKSVREYYEKLDNLNNIEKWQKAHKLPKFTQQQNKI